MSRRTTTTPITRNKPSTMSTDFDDWETDPDFVRDMGEMDQRWGGNARTAGSINMNQLIDDVRRDHQNMRERFQHPSQKDHSEGFGGKFGVQHDRKDQSALNYDYHEKLSKHTSQEITRKIITTSKSDLFGDDGKGGVSDARKTFLEKTQKTFSESRSPPPLAVKPDFGDRFSSNTNKVTSSNDTRTSPNRADQEARDMPQAFKSIQDKIDAFKKEFEEIENKVAKKADLSKVIKKTTNLENTSNVQYVSRSEATSASPISPTTTTSNFRPMSTSPLGRKDNNNSSSPKTSIKSLSEKFETLYRDDGEDFKRKTEAKRKEFFDQIKHQVRETRKGLDGFDPIDDDIDDARYVTNSGATQNDTTSKPSYFKASTNTTSSMPTSTSPSSRPSSRLSQDSHGSKPKVYTRSEITREEVVSKLVKENDKVIENETKRNVERTSSCHGSSDGDDDEPTSIKHLDKTMRSSPLQGHTSPIDELKRKIPVVEPEIKGAGLMARTLFDYTAVEEDELTFDVDDLITNIEKIDPGWYKGTITKGNIKKVGLFPANHVKLLNDDGEY